MNGESPVPELSTADCRLCYGTKLAEATLRAASLTRTRRNAPFHFGSRRIWYVSVGESASPSFGSSRTHSFASTLYSASRIGERESFASNSRTWAEPGRRRMTGGVLSTMTGEVSRADVLGSSGL